MSPSLKSGQQLILFRDASELSHIQRLLSGPKALPAVVAIASPDMQRMLAGISKITKCCFIELPEPLFVVSEEVIEIVKKINLWLEALAPNKAVVPRELMRWPYNVEGGLLNQRVQDALLLIRSYLHLIEENDIVVIQGFVRADSIWEDSVLRHVADSRNVPFRLHGEFYAVAPHIRRAIAKLRPFAVAAYYVFNVCRLRGGTNPPIPRAAVAFQLFGSSQKNIANIVPLLLELRRRAHPVVAWCWMASERRARDPADVQITRLGIPAIRLERHLNWGDILGGFIIAIHCALRRREIAIPDLTFRGVDLRKLLQPSFSHFIIAELPQRCRLYRALNNCWRASMPQAMKVWGGAESFEGQITANLNGTNGRVLIFHYWIGASMKWPYTAPKGTIDLFFAKGQHEAALASQEYSLDADRVVIVGQARFEALLDIAANFSRAASRARIGLPERGSLYVAYDPNANLRGLQSELEQYQAAAVLLRVATRNPNVIIAIKPHPSYPIAKLAATLANARLANVVLLPAEISAAHFLNSCDVFITKYSTLILESALIERPTISVLFDNNEHFKVYGDIPVPVHSEEEFESLLTVISASDEEFAKWRDFRVAKQNNELPVYYFRGPRGPSETAIDALLELIRSESDRSV